jgi:hypothetical protein
MIIGESLFNVCLPSGNRAVYSVQPQHIPRDDIPESFNWPILYGKQIAVEFDGTWHDGKNKITDLKTIALLERVPTL